MDADGPAGSPIAANWDRVRDDMAATADGYREAGWTVLELMPGDVNVLAGGERAPEGPGFDVLVADDEYDRLRAAVADRSVDRYETYRAIEGGVVFLLVAIEAEGDLAVVFPVYYPADEADDLRGHDSVTTYLRSLSTDRYVTFSYANPEPFLPPADAGTADGSGEGDRSGEGSGDDPA